MPDRAPRAGVSKAPRAATSAKPRRKSARERGYTTGWEKARRLFLAEFPLCEECLVEGVAESANVVDHKIPHRGDMTLFWDRSNWRSLCTPHHDRKRGEEKGRRRY